MEISVYTKYSIASAVVGVGMLVVGVMVFGDTLFKSPEIVCTQEAKICSDGSVVGRTGPMCAFAACPTLQSTPTTTIKTNAVVPVIPAPTGCTKEAKVCPDGSSVGRVAPSCDFATCPKPITLDTESGTITGMVRVGPTCPVERISPDPNCADKPASVELALMDTDQKQTLQTFTSKTDGTFFVNSKVGSYVIVQKEGSPIFPRCSQSEIFTVPARSSVKVDITCDTGIR